ncbi:hypothetical protein STIAU_6571 [Stigmatella aurantiaca DW4/3-1]|uniref:Uncharacterized protein n=1 Tax=Stigmatella aurantiaca (strain DW4/3-1) TaxID=378806 RepID=Q08P38_STIAD|nr:hypothetical protein STIAU_6571 [Stigmatella aurantiaca DW4/3-1]
MLHQLLRGQDVQHQPVLLGLGRRHVTAREDELLGAHLPHQPREPLRAAEARDDAECHLGHPQLCLLRGVDEIARQGQLAAPAEREAIHRRDGGAAQVLQHAHDPLAQGSELAGPLRADGGHLGDVRAGHEGLLAPARDDEDAGVRAQRPERGLHLEERLGVERVERLGPINREGRDRALLLQPDVVVDHGRLLLREKVSVLVEAAAALLAVPAGIHVLPQQRARAVLVIAQPLVKHLGDGQARVQADEVRQLQRAHGLVGAQLHRRVDVLRRPQPLHQREARLVQHGDEDAVDDEARHVPGHHRRLAHAHGQGPRRLVGGVRGRRAPDDLHELHHRHRVHEVHADHRLGPLRHRADAGDGDRRGVGGQHAARFHHPVQLLEDALLELFVLRRGLHGEVHLLHLGEARGGGEVRLGGLALGILQLALLHQLRQARADAARALGEPLFGDIHQRDAQPRLERDLRDARAHLPCPDDDHMLGVLGCHDVRDPGRKRVGRL